MTATDVRLARLEKARLVRTAHDVRMPPLKYWNYDPCPTHDSPHRDCRECGGDLMRHQRVGVSWLYLAGQGLLGDSVGLGKTIHALALLALLKERGELTGRAMIVCLPAATLQWLAEARRFVPKLHFEAAIGNKRQRIEKYCSNADAIIIHHQLYLRDVETILKLEPSVLVIDDIDPLRHPDTKTAYALKRLARNCERVIDMTATSLQTGLEDLHSHLETVGGREALGSLEAFRRRYVREEQITVFDHKTGRKKTESKVVGYKNVDEFKRLIQDIVLRRTHDDVDDADLPTIMPPTEVWLDLHEGQREKYTELQRGVLRLITEEGTRVKQATAMSKFTYGSQICGGLATLGEPDGPGASSKLDWLCHELTNDLSDRKVVVFARWKNTIRALHTRLDALGVGYETIWGDERDPVARRSAQDRFWTDPHCRVMVGTQAMEQSLNLQIANILINVDMMLNPQRMVQLAGRLRRAGSAHRHIWIYNLLCRETQEEKYMGVLEHRAALADYVWDERSDMFEALSPLQLLQMIKP